MLHFDDIVFGPVHSRRLGTSLGLNILPVRGKTCNFDCVYCECGWNRYGVVAGKRFPTGDEVEKAMEAAFAAVRQVASFAAVGNDCRKGVTRRV